MLKYKLEKNKSVSSSSCCCCEVCGRKPARMAGINEFHKDGTNKIHHSCSKHIIDLYNKITKEIENK